MERYGLPPEAGFKTGKRGILPERPTLVLIHGAGGQAQNFLPQLRFLDRHLNVLALELPGHGSTPGEGFGQIEDYAAWVHGCLEKAAWGPCYLGGHSMGGAVGLEVGMRFPGRIKGLVLMASGARFGVSPKILEGLEKDPHQTMVRINQWCYPKGTAPGLIAQAVRMMEETPASVTLKDFLACSRYDRRDRLGQFALPALILTGDQDIMTPPENAHYLHEKIPASVLAVIPGAGHMLMLEKPGEINQAILAFIQNHLNKSE
jgi:pimeloyl-ACP methyl ester carboxylesterase